MGAPAQPAIKGLPEGVEWVRFGTAAPDEFELINAFDIETKTTLPRIYQGVRPGASSGVIVKPAEGYSFRLDVKKMSFFPVKSFEQHKPIKASISFSVANDFEETVVRAALEKMRQLPGFEDLQEDL